MHKDEAKTIAELVDKLSDDELFAAIPEEIRVKIYRRQKRVFVEEDIRNWLEDHEATADEDEIKDAVDWFEDKEDCGVPYWDNIETAIDRTIDVQYK